MGSLQWGQRGKDGARFFTCHILPITTAYGVSSDGVGCGVRDSKGVKGLISLELWELVVVQQVAETPGVALSLLVLW